MFGSTKSLQSHSTLCDHLDYSLLDSSVHGMDSPGKSTGVGCYALLQGIFPTHGLSPHLLSLLHWQADSLPLVPPGKPHLICTLPLKKSLQIKKPKKQQQQNKKWTCGETCVLNYLLLLKPPRWCTRNLKFHLSFVSFARLGCVKKREE